MLHSVAKLAKEEIAPLVRKMEKEGKVDDNVLKALFENGVSNEYYPFEYYSNHVFFGRAYICIVEF